MAFLSNPLEQYHVYSYHLILHGTKFVGDCRSWFLLNGKPHMCILPWIHTSKLLNILSYRPLWSTNLFTSAVCWITVTIRNQLANHSWPLVSRTRGKLNPNQSHSWWWLNINHSYQSLFKDYQSSSTLINGCIIAEWVPTIKYVDIWPVPGKKTILFVNAVQFTC